MDELICRALNGGASEAEKARLLVWRRASPDNERHYRELVHLLDEAAETELTEHLDPAPLIEDMLSPTSFGGPRFRHGSTRRSRRLMAVSTLAAAVVLFVVAAEFKASADRGSSFGTGEVVTGPSELATVRLGDGTVVRMGPQSRIRVARESGRREVWMEGRAFFAVAKDEERPFRIRTHAGDAVVLGTRFDLQAREDDLRVLVVEGAVKLGTRGNDIAVEASQLGTMSASLPPVRQEVDREFIRRELGWIGNFVVFENTPLGQAAQELSVHYGVPIEVLDSLLARETVSGVFADESLEEIARVLCRAVSAHCSIRQVGITIGL